MMHAWRNVNLREVFKDQKVTKPTPAIIIPQKPDLFSSACMFSPTCEHSGSVCRRTLCKSLWIRASAKWLKCKCKMTGPGDLPALDVCAFSMAFRFALDKRERGEKKRIFVPKERKMNRGIWRHKSVSDRLKGWNRERTDTLVGFLKWRLPSRYERGMYDIGNTAGFKTGRAETQSQCAFYL